MSLWWNIGEVKGFTLGDNKRSSHIQGYPDRPDSVYGGQTEMNPITTSLINTTMLIGMSSITEKNWKTFYYRCWIYKKITNSGMIADFNLGVCCPNKNCTDNGSGPAQTRSFTAKEIVDHIGLVTNAETFTKAQYYKYLLERAEKFADRDSDRELLESDYGN
jgi:hypothetical protein